MGLYENVPYTNFHGLQLDWLVKVVKQLQEAVGSLTGDELQEAVNTYLNEHPGLFPFVIPQFFGAKGDGVTDDTAAFQAAVDTGYDVYVPTDHGEVYIVSAPIVIPKECKKIYGSGSWYRGTSSYGVIKRVYSTAGMKSQNDAIFRIGIGLQGFNLVGLRFILGTANDSNSGILLDASTSQVVDKDINIVDCSVKNASVGITFNGRGLRCSRVGFGSCTTAAEINYIGTDSNDSRGIRFVDCRFHAMVGDWCIDVQSGHAYGFIMSGCLADKGLHGLVHCAEQAIEWLITNNVIRGAYRLVAQPYGLKFDAGLVDSVISDNIFDCSDTAGSGAWYHHIWASGTSEHVVISGNMFNCSNMSMVRFTGDESVNNIVFSGNTFRGVAYNNSSVNTYMSAIQISNTNGSKGIAITGNSVGVDGATSRLLTAHPSTVPMTHSSITGNVCGATLSTNAYDSNTCVLAGNVGNLV